MKESMKNILVTGKSAKTYIIESYDDAHCSPYAIAKSWYMSNEKAAKEGFQFTNLNDWLKPLIETIAKAK